MTTHGAYLRSLRLDNPPRGTWPFNLPAFVNLEHDLNLDAPIVAFCGDNGAGKSTLIEALAVACGFNAEGGSANFRFTTRKTDTSLANHLIVARHPGAQPATGYFLRAESFFNVATEIERLDADPDTEPLLPAYGGVSFHERSHGEGFLALVNHRFGPRGLYILDEPEAALSVHGCLALLSRMVELAGQGSQFFVATHSPILLAAPGAVIYQCDETGTHEVDYDDADPVALTRGFLASPERFLRHLFTSE
ncbi:AAA family ATPase [Salininema proteolyticum]|uniref:AAA family ATPase n=1 Tax=Salininema proteolyticum TaxID=1607685 RepID=A0ABV8U3A2_9ACTN